MLERRRGAPVTNAANWRQLVTIAPGTVIFTFGLD